MLLSPETAPIHSGIHGSSDVAAGDLDHDGRIDLVVANSLPPDSDSDPEFDSDSVSVLLNKGGPFEFDGPINIRVGSRPVAVAIANFNQDNLPGGQPLMDIVTANFGDKNISFLLNKNTTDAPEFLLSNFGVGRGPTSLTVSSGAITLDGDDRPDLIVANLMSDNFSVLNQSLPGEVPGVIFDADGVTLRWDAAARVPEVLGLGSYNVIRGTIWNLVDINFDGVSETYGDCIARDVAPSDRSMEDTEDPPRPGVVRTYLVTGENGLGEGTIGFASSTGQRLGLSTSPCF